MDLTYSVAGFIAVMVASLLDPLRLAGYALAIYACRPP
jgi:hypothetical protein